MANANDANIPADNDNNESKYIYQRGRRIQVGQWDLRVVEPMTTGGFGSQLYRARTDDSERSLVLKLHPDDPSFARVARDAFAIWSTVRQDLVAAGFADVLWSDGVHGLTEYVHGSNILDHEDTVDALTIPQIHSIMLQMAERVGKLMDLGVVHGDIKPENTIATFDTPTSSPRDLRIIDLDTMRRAGSYSRYIYGSPDFMSPEQFDGNALRTSDVFALGMSTLFMLADDRRGLDLFDVYRYAATKPELINFRTTNKTFRPNARKVLEQALLHHDSPDVTLARQLIDFLFAATQHDPATRPQSGEEMRQILTDTGI